MLILDGTNIHKYNRPTNIWYGNAAAIIVNMKIVTGSTWSVIRLYKRHTVKVTKSDSFNKYKNTYQLCHF